MAGSAGLRPCRVIWAGDLVCKDGRGSHSARKKSASCWEAGQSPKSSQNSKMQQSTNTVSDISSVNSRQEDNFNPCLGLGLKFAEDILYY